MIFQTLAQSPAPQLGQPRIFQTPWWLDAVAPGSWTLLSAQDSNSVVAIWPIVRRDRYGIKMIGHPPLTPYQGPWFSILTEREIRAGLARDRTRDIIGRLPSVSIIRQRLAPENQDWLPYRWANFSQTTQYSYIISGKLNPSDVFSQAAKGVRWSIRNAEKSLRVLSELDVSRVYDLFQKTLGRNHAAVPFDASFLQRVVDAAMLERRGQLLLAEDNDGEPHAAAFFVWDDSSVYYILGGSDARFNGSGAPSLLIWRAIEAALDSGRDFDFEGSMIPGIEGFFRKFGGILTPINLVSRERGLGRIQGALRTLTR